MTLYTTVLLGIYGFGFLNFGLRYLKNCSRLNTEDTHFVLVYLAHSLWMSNKPVTSN